MERINKWCLFLALIIVYSLALYFIGEQNGRDAGSRIFKDTVTVVYTDTVPFYLPTPKDSVIIRFETIFVPAQEPDSSGMLQPEAIRLPIESKVYKDSTYTAYVSGYKPNLDSIFVYPKTVFVTEREVKLKPPNRWGLSLTAGYGYMPGEGMKPFVGVGISYTLKPLKWR